ncbi:MAG: DUF5591 domain-containing protein [Archaeoglobus sp.]|nr:DUF5591 domain-containing protein [Archaeoglobus sp.]
MVNLNSEGSENSSSIELYLVKRDGWARIAELRLREENEKRAEKIRIITPTVLSSDNPLLNEIDFDLVPYSLKPMDAEKFVDLYREDKNFIVGSGLAPLSPKELVKCLTELRKKSIVKPLILTGIATPQNLPMLCYFGVDIFDDSRARIAAHEGYYLLENGAFKLEKLKELPCSCSACERVRNDFSELNAKEKTAFLIEHNVKKLQEQALLVRELIRSESLRNFVEARAKTSPELTVMLRLENRFYEKIHPRFKRSLVYMNTIESFRRPEVTIFLEKISEAYKPKTKTALILPCSARKPYLLSKTHRRILYAIGKLVDFVDEIIVSSPLVCPREFELTYPAQNYDTPVTGVWSAEEIDFVADKLAGLLQNFERIIAHVTGGYREVVERAVEIKGKSEIEVVYTAENGITGEALKNLRSVLEEVKEEVKDEADGADKPYEDYRKDRFMALFEAMFRYQFGVELDEFVEKGKVRGRYPNLELIDDETNKRQLRVDNLYGMLDIDLPLAKKLIERGIYVVELGDFDPKGTIFSAGVVEADDRIRPNDIVFFRNSRFYGVGRALMCGVEMVEASKGVAIEVRRKAPL